MTQIVMPKRLQTYADQRANQKCTELKTEPNSVLAVVTDTRFWTRRQIIQNACQDVQTLLRYIYRIKRASKRAHALITPIS